MAQTRYRKGKVQSRTAENLLIDVFGDFGLTSSQYNIDSALSSITFGGNIPVVSYREAVQIICNAAQSVVYIDRDNVIQVKQLTATASVDTIDFDNVAAIPKIKLDKRINTAEIAVSEYDAKAASRLFSSGELTHLNGEIILTCKTGDTFEIKSKSTQGRDYTVTDFNFNIHKI